MGPDLFMCEAVRVHVRVYANVWFTRDRSFSVTPYLFIHNLHSEKSQ